MALSVESGDGGMKCLGGTLVEGGQAGCLELMPLAGTDRRAARFGEKGA